MCNVTIICPGGIKTNIGNNEYRKPGDIAEPGEIMSPKELVNKSVKAIIDKKTSRVFVDPNRKQRVYGSTGAGGITVKNMTDNMILQDPSTMAINSEERQAEIGSLFNHVFFIDNTEFVDPESVEGPTYQGAPPPPPMKRSFREAILYDLRKKVHGESKSSSVPVVFG